MTEVLHGLEGITVARWVYGTLTADQVLADLLGVDLAELEDRVWEGVAPAGTGAPWVTFTVLEPQDVGGPGLTPIWATVEVQVRVTATGESYGPLVQPYARIHALLDGRTNVDVPGGGVINTCRRVSGVQFPETANGVHYRHLGGRYATETQ